MRAPFVRRRVGVGPGACDRSGAMRGQHAPRGAHAGSARDGSLAWEFCELAHSRPLWRPSRDVRFWWRSVWAVRVTQGGTVPPACTRIPQPGCS